MKRLLLLMLVGLLMVAVKLSAQDMALKTNVLYDATTTINLGYEVALGRKTTLNIEVNYNPWVLGHKYYAYYESTSMSTMGTVWNVNRVDKREVKMKQLWIQPELRWWVCEKFNGHFFGIHLHGGIFNVGSLDLPFGAGNYDLGTSVPLSNVNIATSGTTDPTSGSVIIYKKGVLDPQTGQNPYQPFVDKVGSAVANSEVGYANMDRDGVYANSFEGWFAGAGIDYGYHWILGRRFSMEFTIGIGYAYFDYEKSRCTTCKQPLADESSHYFGPTKLGISLVYMLK